MTISIPQPKMILIDELKVDGENPNVMSPAKFNALKKNIQKFGFLIPIITNNELLVADGEHRLKAGKELGMDRVPVIMLDVKDVDRKIIRQVMNKLRGEHNPSRDKSEFDFILQNDGRQDLLELMALTESDLEKFMEDRSPLDLPPITPEYLEEYNYVLVFFRNALDWEVAKDTIGLPIVRTNESSDKFKKVRQGTGRVLEGKDFLKLIGKEVPVEKKDGNNNTELQKTG